MKDSPSTSRTDWSDLEQIFSEYLSGDAEAARRFYSRIVHPLQGYFQARVGASTDREDLLQATLLKIHFARDRYDPRHSLKTWVFTIASRTLIDHWRGVSTEQGIYEYPRDSQDAIGDSRLESASSELLDPEQKVQLHRDLNCALKTLKPIERSIVYLYGVEGLSMAEIADVLSLSEGAVKLRAHRAYQDLRRLLGVLALTFIGMRWI